MSNAYIYEFQLKVTCNMSGFTEPSFSVPHNPDLNKIPQKREKILILI